MTIKTETYTLPAHWASTLINGDDSGNEPEDDAQIEAWLSAHPHLGGCLTCSDDEGEFRHRHDASFVGVLACTCLEFTFPVSEGQS